MYFTYMYIFIYSIKTKVTPSLPVPLLIQDPESSWDNDFS